MTNDSNELQERVGLSGGVKIALIVFGLSVAYVLSLGPAVAWFNSDWFPESDFAANALQRFYYPLEFLSAKSRWCGRFFHWYVEFFD